MGTGSVGNTQTATLQRSNSFQTSSSESSTGSGGRAGTAERSGSGTASSPSVSKPRSAASSLNPNRDINYSSSVRNAISKAYSETVSEVGTKSADILHRGVTNIGKWWGGVKEESRSSLKTAFDMAGVNSNVNAGVKEFAARQIAKSDDVPLEIGRQRVPKGMGLSKLGSGLATVGKSANRAFSALDLAEAYSKEGKFGKETQTLALKTVGQAATGAVATAVTVGAATVAGVTAAPLLLGAAVTVGASWAFGEAFDYATSPEGGKRIRDGLTFAAKTADETYSWMSDTADKVITAPASWGTSIAKRFF